MIRNISLLSVLVLSTVVCAMYFGLDGGVFDKSPDGFGGNQGYSRKVQTLYFEGSECIASFHKKLDSGFGNGVIGGMMADWSNGEYFSSYSESVYTNSLYQSVGSLPGGRYPYICDFINLNSFGIFNDYDTASGETVSQPMFVTGDASWSWDWAIWSEPKRIESSDSSVVIPNAWQGTGDVVYDPVSGYYYWTIGFKEGLSEKTSPVSCVIGKSYSPWTPESWVWSDYRDLRFDLDCIVGKESTYDQMSVIQFAYAKDNYGNGNGKGIGIAVTGLGWIGKNDLSYTYTNNWGADSLSGSWKPNWSNDFAGLMRVPLEDLFDWVGETLTLRDSIGFNLSTNTVFSDSADITIDTPYIMNDISVVVTENNIVHVLCMVFPASTEYPYCIFPWTNSGFRAGYYDIRGEITDTGVTWMPAVFIANPIDNNKGWLTDDGGMEFRQGDNRTLSLSYWGNGSGFLMAGWLDKPWSRAVPFNEYDTQRSYNYMNDGFIILSKDGGNTWIHGYTAEVPSGNPEDPTWELKYAGNATETNALHEDGWTLATHGGTIKGESYGCYAVCQYTDYSGLEDTYLDYPQFLHVWYAGYAYGGIEPEDITITTDFELYQNYPNPFNPATEIKFALSDASTVKLKIYNSYGQLVKTLFDGEKKSGLHSVFFSADEFNSGIYFYQLDVNGETRNKKMVLVK